MSRPIMLDLFSGAGGAAAGYHRAGFDVVGIDHLPQPRYPFLMGMRDALETLRYLIDGGHVRFLLQGGHMVRPALQRRLCLADFAAIHASPPCQRYSRTRAIRGGGHHPDLVGPTRDLLTASAKPWVIENVGGAPLGHSLMLCGTHFGLKVIRHRFFESDRLLMSPGQPCRHPPPGTVPKTGYGAGPTGFVCVAGHLFQVARAREAMGVDWMTRDELAQTVPPSYTCHVGLQLLRALESTP